MSNWRAGDKAVCVDDSPSINTGIRPLKNGTTYLVERVVCNTPPSGFALALAGIPHTYVGWTHTRFRKVVTATERAAQEQEGLVPHEGFWQGREET